VVFHPRKLLVVEDEPLVASLLARTLESEGFVVLTASTVAEATQALRGFDPDIAVIDINLGRGPSGLELAFVLHKKYPAIALMLLTKHPDIRTAGYSPKDLPPGCGFIRKDLMGDSSALLQSIEQAIADKLEPRPRDDPKRPLGKLTPSQIEILRLIAMGYTNIAIARRRDTSSRAVEKVLKSIYQALEIPVDGDLNPRVEAVRHFVFAAGVPERK
jgi:DNA-binding NarL/FixJ family response regulator